MDRENANASPKLNKDLEENILSKTLRLETNLHVTFVQKLLSEVYTI